MKLVISHLLQGLGKDRKAALCEGTRSFLMEGSVESVEEFHRVDIGVRVFHAPRERLVLVVVVRRTHRARRRAIDIA